jgi:hypothetical protein
LCAFADTTSVLPNDDNVALYPYEDNRRVFPYAYTPARRKTVRAPVVARPDRPAQRTTGVDQVDRLSA